MADISHNASELNTRIDSIATANNEGKNSLEPKTSSCGSTTKIPKNEGVVIVQLLNSIKSLYGKLDGELANIKSVGDNFATMDNFLANESLDLGFEVTSNGVNVEALSSYAAESLAELLGKDVPIIQGYNDPSTLSGGSSSDDDDDGSYGSYGGYSGISGDDGGGASVKTEPQTQPQTPTEAPTEVQTVAPTEVITEVPTDLEPVVETEPETTVPVVETPTEMPTAGTETKPPSEGGVSHKPPHRHSDPLTQPEVPTVIEEPIIEEEPLEEEQIVEEPVIDEYVEPDMNEEIIEEPMDIEEEVIDIAPVEGQTQTPKKSNAGKVAGTIAGIGLAAGAAAVGYGMYKKSKEDKEYEDYGYEEDGGAY